jgi:hypothetical protein
MLFGPKNWQKTCRRKNEFRFLTVIVCGNLGSIIHDQRKKFCVDEEVL